MHSEEAATKYLAFAARSASSRNVRRAFCLTLVAAVLSGCFASNSSTDKLLDAAHDHNVAQRFGRMDVALEHVSASVREDWLRRRSGWRNGVRIIDVELDGLQIATKNEASVHVRVSWQRVDEVEMRATELAQTWSSKNGPWQLVKEECASGDEALLGEPSGPHRPVPSP